MNIVWGGVILIATEIVTAGLGKFVTIGVATLRATRAGEAVAGVTARVATRATDLITRRYNALSPRTKARLDRLRRTPADEVADPPSNGTAGDRGPDAPTTPRGVCALC